MDAEYLKKEVGPVLARGLAELAFVRPTDPAGYLSQWLLNYDDLKKRQAKMEVDQTEVDKARAEHDAIEAERRRQLEEEQAAKERAVLEHETQRYEALMALISPYEKALEDALQMVGQLSERGAKAEPLAKWKAKLEQLRKLFANNEDLRIEMLAMPRAAKGSSPMVEKVVSIALYLIDTATIPHEPWKNCRKLIRDGEWIKKIADFDPVQRQRVIKFRRARRALASINGEDARKTSFAAFLLYEWVQTCVEIRKAAVTYKNTKLGLPEESGDDTDENSDEEEDLNQVVAKIVRAELEADELEREARRREASGNEGEDDGDDQAEN